MFVYVVPPMFVGGGGGGVWRWQREMGNVLRKLCVFLFCFVFEFTVFAV